MSLVVAAFSYAQNSAPLPRRLPTSQKSVTKVSDQSLKSCAVASALSLTGVCCIHPVSWNSGSESTGLPPDKSHQHIAVVMMLVFPAERLEQDLSNLTSVLHAAHAAHEILRTRSGIVRATAGMIGRCSHGQLTYEYRCVC